VLIKEHHFNRLFEPLVGHKVCYAAGWAGSTGDDLIHAAAHQLFDRYGINMVDLEDATAVVFGGGGNWGSYAGAREFREKVYRIIRRGRGQYQYVCSFPQSIWTSDEPIPEFIDAFYVREKESLRLCGRALLGPDIALGYTHDILTMKATETQGVFLRDDAKEGLFIRVPNLGDPLKAVPRDLDAYLQLAMRYQHIITDRLHFAIAGLIVGREVTFLPNRYHKNRSMYETWLRDCGCRWGEEPPS